MRTAPQQLFSVIFRSGLVRRRASRILSRVVRLISPEPGFQIVTPALDWRTLSLALNHEINLLGIVAVPVSGASHLPFALPLKSAEATLAISYERNTREGQAARHLAADAEAVGVSRVSGARGSIRWLSWKR